MADAIVFRPTFWETAQAFRDISYAQPVIRWLRRIGWGCFFLGFAMPILGLLSVGAGITFLGLASLILVLLWIMPYMLSWMFRRGSLIWRGEQVVTFDSRGLTSGAGGAQGFLSWSDVTRVAETKRFFLVYTSNRCACWLPKHAVEMAGTGEEFRAVAAAYAGKEQIESSGMGAASAEQIGDEKISVSYRWTVGELYRASMALAKHGGRQWLLLLVMAALVLWTGGPTIYRQWEIGGWAGINWPLALLYAAPLLIFLAAKPVGGFWYAYTHARSSPIAQQEQLIRVGENGIAARGAMSSTGVRWEGLVKVVETSQYFLFFLNKISGLVVPKRALEEVRVPELRRFLSERLGSKFIMR